MSKITEEQYKVALARIEELLPLVDDDTPLDDKNVVSFIAVSELVIAYEEEHYPMKEPIGENDVEMNSTTQFTEKQYEIALAIIEKLHPLVKDNTPLNDKNVIEFIAVAELVIAYEKKHFPIGKLTNKECANDSCKLGYYNF